MQAHASPESLLLPHTREAGDPYYIGDIYERIRQTIPSLVSNPPAPPGPYLNYLRELAIQWPQVQYLVDFMDVTCAPPKRKLLNASDQVERASRVKIALLEFGKNRAVRRTDVNSAAELRGELKGLHARPDKKCSRLFVVEDLSRETIEILGASFDIDPRFFRGHISDYMWYNTRDPWVDFPEFECFSAGRDYFHVRYVQQRYFENYESLRQANLQAGAFNVLRRIDTADDVVLELDERQSIVAMVRSKASLWVRQNDSIGVIGIMLLDPSISEGVPLWGGYRYFGDHASMSMKNTDPRPQSSSTSQFENFIYWTLRLTESEKDAIDSDPRVFALKALMMICSNWMVMIEYATTRLTQIEWSVEEPLLQLHSSRNLEECLKRLHRWRRVLPVYQTMASNVLSTVIKRDHSHWEYSSQLRDLRPDFDKIVEQLVSLQNRAERVISLVAAVIAVAESKKAVQQNTSLTRLTYLACVFIPLQFVSSLFSMTTDLGGLTRTIWIYVVVSVPLTALCIMAVVFLGRQQRG